MGSHNTSVIIAEDELLVRIGIKSSIDWEESGFQLLGEASEGDDAVMLVRKYIPDILLLDIKLPGLSGLDILRIIQEEAFPTKVIIISGLDDFVSVKTAMQLGAYDYIHKPRLEYGELLQVMTKIRNEFFTCTEKISIVRKEIPQIKLLKQIVNIKDDFNETEWFSMADDILKGQCYCIMHVSLLSINEKKKKNPNYDEELLYKTVENLFAEVCDQRQFIWYVAAKKNRYVFLLTAKVNDGVFLKRKVYEVAKTLRTMIRRFVDIDASFGISSVEEKVENVINACGEAYKAWETTYFRENRICEYSDLKEVQASSTGQYSTLIERMDSTSTLEYIGKHIEYFKCLCELINSNYHISRRQLIYHLQNMIYRIVEQDIVICEKWFEMLQECESLQELKKCYINNLMEYKQEKGIRYSGMVGQIIDYLKINYHEDISLVVLSEVFHLNEHYISRIFKEETKENYLTYLNRVRINIAKKMLLETDLKIYEIAEKVGFKSSINFNYVFNRFCGNSPKMYREQNKK